MQVVETIDLAKKAVNEGFEHSFLVGILVVFIMFIVTGLVYLYLRSEKKDDKQNETLLKISNEHSAALERVTNQRLEDEKKRTNALQEFMNNLFNDQKDVQLQTNQVIKDYTNTVQLQTKTLEAIAQSNNHLRDEVKDIKRDISGLREKFESHRNEKQ